MNSVDVLSKSGSSPPGGLSVPQQALWWLKKGGFALGPAWEKAHALCQQGEGTHQYDLVHALAHWIEGDENNTAYWYRKVGSGRAATIPEEWNRIADIVS